eukprot:scaffold101356_cov42-Attheya_sp.AAC.2
MVCFQLDGPGGPFSSVRSFRRTCARTSTSNETDSSARLCWLTLTIRTGTNRPSGRPIIIVSE